MQFNTQDLAFAAWLHCTDALRFVGCEPNGFGKVTFIFSDPEGRGEALTVAYTNGADTAHVREFYDSVRHLRIVMNRRKEANHGQNYRNNSCR